MSDKKTWLVTVQGCDPTQQTPVTISTTIVLPNNKIPTDWFLKEPTIFYKFEFEFKPIALLNFWEISKNESTFIDECVVYPKMCPNKCYMTTFTCIRTHIWKCEKCKIIIDLRIENNYNEWMDYTDGR